MESKKLFSPLKTQFLGQRPQPGSGHQTDDAGEPAPIVPIGLRSEEKRQRNPFQYEPHSTAILRSHDSSPPCIMVVENNQSLAAMLEDALASWGYLVCVARNGQEGLTLLATHSVDAILLDLHMPVMNGLTMLDELRWAGYTMPVWVMSGGMDAPALRQLLDEGAQGFLIKPFRLLALQQAVIKMIECCSCFNGANVQCSFPSRPEF